MQSFFQHLHWKGNFLTILFLQYYVFWGLQSPYMPLYKLTLNQVTYVGCNKSKL
jgi:hypothetical protein